MLSSRPPSWGKGQIKYKRNINNMHARDDQSPWVRCGYTDLGIASWLHRFAMPLLLYILSHRVGLCFDSNDFGVIFLLLF